MPELDNAWFTEIFAFNGFISQPYTMAPLYPTLRRVAGSVPEFMDEFVGDAFQVGSPGKARGKNLIVPENTLAVILLADGTRKTLGPGRCRVSKVLGKQRAVSVHFVNLQERSVPLEDIEVHTGDHLILGVNAQLAVQVSKELMNGPTAEKLLQWADPFAAMRGFVTKELIVHLAEMTHADAARKLATDVTAKIKEPLEKFLQAHGLNLNGLLITRLQPAELEQKAALARRQRQLDFLLKLNEMEWEYDNKMRDLALRGQIVDANSEIQRREAQAEEDVVALKQTKGRREIAGKLVGEARERNQAARMEAIEAVRDIAKALMEELHKHPGRMYGQQDMQPLLKALELLEKLSLPDNYPPPKVPQQVRSFFAVDDDQPPPPPVKLPEGSLPVKKGSVWDKTPPAPEPTETL